MLISVVYNSEVPLLMPTGDRTLTDGRKFHCLLKAQIYEIYNFRITLAQFN